METHIEVATEQSMAKAIAAIVLYGASNNVTFAMQHPIENGALGAGAPITMSGLLAALTALATEQDGFSKDDFLPDNILSVSHSGLVWWRKPGKRSVFFRTQNGESAFEAPHPGLVFAASGNNLHIAAVMGNDRPTSETPVYEAPYMNVWKGGRLCVGNVPLPGSTLVQKIGAWEDAFFGSYFSHPNGTGLVKHPGDMQGLWTELAEKLPATFPEEVLVPMGVNAAQFCMRIKA